LQSAAKVIGAVKKQKTAVQKMTDVALERALGDGVKLIAEDDGAVTLYSSALFAYFNSAEPAMYDEYCEATQTRPVSVSVENQIAEVAYRRLYAQLEKLQVDGQHAEAGYQLEILGRVALARGGSFLVRELAKKAEVTTLHLLSAHGGIHPTINLDTDWVRLAPCHAAPAVLPGHHAPTAVPASSAEPLCDSPGITPADPVNRIVSSRLNHGDNTGSSSDVLPDRTMLFSLNKRYPNFDVVDAKLRGYNFTVSMSHSIAYSSLVERLDYLGATAENPLYLYFCVPEKAFREGFKSAQALKVNKVNVSQELADAASSRLRQFVLLIPASL
jgi:hypothetical protein